MLICLCWPHPVLRQGSTLAALEQNYKTYQALAAAGAVPAPAAGGAGQPAGKGGIEQLGQDAGAEAMDVSDDDMEEGAADGMAVDGAGHAGGKQGKGKVSHACVSHAFGQLCSRPTTGCSCKPAASRPPAWLGVPALQWSDAVLAGR
jgi:hypothetical protein